MKPENLSIIIPGRNEELTLTPLVERIHASLASAKISYEIIFVDDHSTDGSVAVMERLSKDYPILIHTKRGKAGKAYSIIEGARLAKSEWIVMIDADLQYPPEAIPAMVEKAQKHGIVVANRRQYKGSCLRRVLSRTNAFVFGKLLFGISTDIQSGLKLFRKDILGHIDENSIRPWAFDLPLLSTAREVGYSIGSVDISFELRQEGASKINLTKTAWEIASGALITWLNVKPIYTLPPKSEGSMIGAGIAHKRTRFITHSTLPHQISAIKTFLFWQQVAIAMTITLVVAGLILHPLPTAIGIVGILSTIYFVDVLFTLFLVLRSLHRSPDISITEAELSHIDERSLPLYSILCPLYREAHVVPQFLKAIESLDYPKNRLDVMLLLEEDDKETIDEVSNLTLPDYVRILVVPEGAPKTKPKACNYGLAYAKGDYVVVYDAEDIPDPKQLKKAILAFGRVPAKTVCLQAKLNFYNPHNNLLTRLFTAEYSLWFDVVLTGLQSIQTSIPLGGTSNHFRTEILRHLHGWDAFNVTEDCDLGSRLFSAGYKTAVMDSITLEEATSKFGNWMRQRSRWIKGYLQTYLVHMRYPLRFVSRHGIHALYFQLTIGGKIAFMFINPFLWLATISYFTLYAFVGPTIESLYPTVIFYMAVTSLVFGNFLFIYYYMIGAARAGHWSVIKYVFLVPFYWLMVSVAATIAMVQLIVKPHYWEKTNHGFHLDKAKKKIFAVAPKSAKAARRWNFAPVLSPAVLLIAASVLGNLLNFVYNAYLGRKLSLEDFGVIGLIGSLLYAAQIAFSAVSMTVTHKSAYLMGRYDGPATEFWKTVRHKALVVSLFATGIWIGGIPVISTVLHLNSLAPIVLFTPVVMVGLLASVDGGYLSGSQQFTLVSVVLITEAISKLVFAILGVETGISLLVYAAIPLSIVCSFAVVRWLSVRFSSQDQKRVVDPKDGGFPRRFFASTILIRSSSAAFLGLDFLMVRLFVTPIEAGQYALLSLSGKMIFFFGSLFSQFIVPLVSRRVGEGGKGKRQFRILLGLTMIASGIGVLAFGVYGYITAPLLFGERANSIVHLLPEYAIAYAFFTVASTIVTYHQIRHNYVFSAMSFVASAGAIVGITLSHGSLDAIVHVLLVSSLAFVNAVAFTHVFLEPIRVFIRNIGDFLGLFSEFPKQRTAGAALRILVLNWRDTRHTWAGGAEVYVHELAKRWVASGNQVTIFCGNDGKHSRNQVIDGVRVVRRGGFYTVYLWAMLYYVFRFRGKFDVIIDSQNGIPFFAPLYARIPTITVIYHVHQQVFREHLKFPFSSIAAFIESRIAPLVYRGSRIVTVSESSKAEILAHLQYGKDARIDIVSPGVDLSLYNTKSKKTTFPSFLYLGRLKQYKNIDVAIRAFATVRKFHQTARMTIAGEGESIDALRALIKEFDLTTSVSFMGKVDEEEKVRLYSRHWAAIQPSSFEGWGLTVIEANACGTPVIASNVYGLRDSVVDEKTGLLVQPRNVLSFVGAMERMITSTGDRRAWSKNATEWAQNFSWEKSADRLHHVVMDELANAKQSVFAYTIARRTSV
ncbi:hypothetical protein A2971_04390 [Candidatus Gottesmanbacteria bacterium RIFCSPLOWO2_01_FULL_46_21]|uniref:Glycosyltransferase 2-like domain-containing protein n=1 Tax=Candidatus Gottesmanbacteria bacterium RIFCSPLOWO2_01_FULL_46_21 TaxID=1798393 RepID=A0A1F6AZJ7_9BACT|nr:MAG: hypothetical protein A2971_04390 [Candidatus Gottesmanbacteria bacterium RIFCSPLOWO2_01_FULL_46_21]